jgi:hypothetical protein
MVTVRIYLKARARDVKSQISLKSHMAAAKLPSQRQSQTAGILVIVSIAKQLLYDYFPFIF